MNKILYTFVTFVLLTVFPSTLLAEEILFYHTDNFGTPMAMTDMSGKVVWRADELPFGEEYQTEETPERNNRRFLGKQLDRETGLICMGARYLDPRTGRFTQPDPVGLVDPATGKVNQEMLLNPQRLNRYVYALNNPYKYVDPEGDFAILAAYGGYIMASALAAGIVYYGAPIAADLEKRLPHVIWNEKNQSSTPKGPAGTAKDAQKKVDRGQGPRDLGHIDKPDKNIPGSQCGWYSTRQTQRCS